MITFPFNDCWIYNQDLNLNLDEIKNKIYDYHKKNEPTVMVAPKIKGNLKEGSFNFLKESNLFSLEQEILNATDQCLVELLGNDVEFPNAEIVESWYHITSYGGYHGYHNHPITPIGGIYYVSTDECNGFSGDNKFYKPYHTGHPLIYGPLQKIMSDIHQVIPKNNSLILFPGFMYHSASPYYGESDRICIAFNIIL